MDHLLTEEEKRIREETKEFVRWVPRELLISMEEEKIEYPREFVEEAGRRNLLGMRFPKEVGGRGTSWVAELLAIAEIGILGSALGCAFSMPTIVGEALNRFGTPEQKEKYLKPTLQGKLVSAEALTEPRGGSDFFGATTIAKKDGKYYILNGQKRFIVGAKGADYFLVYARTHPTAPGHKAISAFIVERDMGVRVEHVYGLMGLKGGGTGRIVFEEVKVPAENLVGPEHGGTLVFNHMMIPERLTSAAGALGMAKAALEIAIRYSDRRKAFGKKIREFQGVSFKVAECITLIDTMEALLIAVGRAVDSEKLNLRRLISEAKLHATESTWKIVNDAIQILGGIGYTHIYPLEKFVRDGRLGLIWTGSNEVMKLIIQHEVYKEFLNKTYLPRDIEKDNLQGDKDEERVYE